MAFQPTICEYINFFDKDFVNPLIYKKCSRNRENIKFQLKAIKHRPFVATQDSEARQTSPPKRKEQSKQSTKRNGFSVSKFTRKEAEGRVADS